MAKKSTITTPAQYIASLTEPRRTQIAQLDALIRKTAPALKPFFYCGMLGYGPYHYVYASGREGDTAVVPLSSRAQYFALYIGACDDKGSLADQVRAKLPKANIGVGCIRFKRPEDLDLAVLRDLFRKAEKWAQLEARRTSKEQAPAAASRGSKTPVRPARKKSPAKKPGRG